MTDYQLEFGIPRGPQGPQGPVGATGPAGPRGPAGPQGPAGADGVPPVFGAPVTGDPGTQATITGQGTASDPLILTVPRGDTGAPGPQGPQGPQGPAGPAGADGATDATIVGPLFVDIATPGGQISEATMDRGDPPDLSGALIYANGVYTYTAGVVKPPSTVVVKTTRFLLSSGLFEGATVKIDTLPAFARAAFASAPVGASFILGGMLVDKANRIAKGAYTLEVTAIKYSIASLEVVSYKAGDHPPRIGTSDIRICLTKCVAPTT